MRSQARLATHHHSRLLSVRPLPPTCRLHSLCLTSARQSPARLLSSAPASPNARHGTGGTWMNRQNMGGRRNTLHHTPTWHDAEEDEYDDVWPARLPTSTRRYTQLPTQQGAATQQPRKRVVNVYDLPTNIPLRSSRTTTHGYALPPGQPAPRPTPVQPSHRTDLHLHWLLLVGVGMLAMFALWVVGTGLVTWGSTQLDDWQYGRPRTFQIDARVGHNDAVTPSHFIAMNLNRHVMIIELPGGDTSKARIYNGPTLF